MMYERAEIDRAEALLDDILACVDRGESVQRLARALRAESRRGRKEERESCAKHASYFSTRPDRKLYPNTEWSKLNRGVRAAVHATAQMIADQLRHREQFERAYLQGQDVSTASWHIRVHWREGGNIMETGGTLRGFSRGATWHDAVLACLNRNDTRGRDVVSVEARLLTAEDGRHIRYDPVEGATLAPWADPPPSTSPGKADK